MTTAAILLACLALIVSAHSWIYAATTGWYTRHARLWRTDPELARTIHRPWYVLYAEWLP